MNSFKELQDVDNEMPFFDDYFENMDLNEDIRKIYEIIDDDELQDEFEINLKLSKLRNENHKRYYEIDINKIKNLPSDFEYYSAEIVRLYECIIPNELLNDNINSAVNNKKILDVIYRKILKLNDVVSKILKELTIVNDKNQSKFNKEYLNNLDIDYNIKKQIINKYNDLILYDSTIETDCYEDLKHQIVRSNYINEILQMLNIQNENKLKLKNREKLVELNNKIDLKILKYKEKIYYLDDLIIENSKYTRELEKFKDFYNDLISYDDEDYIDSKRVYEILCDDSKFKILYNNLEDLLIKEREDNRKEEMFIYNKFGIKNIKTSLDYITTNYMDQLDDDFKAVIEQLYVSINSNNYNLQQIEKSLGIIVKSIWENTITNVYSYNPDEDYCFICSNNQFIDEKYQTIMISNKELERANDYSDYQIGFICGYNDNILYITENNDIMTVDHNDLSNLKTPAQIEQEFINFKVCNRIALNGFITKIQAVYYIDDGNIDIYLKAVELANQYNLPLIELKKLSDN